MKSRWFWGILAVALLARVALMASAWNHTETTATPDSVGYWQLAQSLRDGHEFSQPSCVEGYYGPEIFRTPGYPLFLAPFAKDSWGSGNSPKVYRIWPDFGPPYSLGKSERIIVEAPAAPDVRLALILQIAIDLLLVVLTYRLAKLFVSERAALCAMGFQAISPLAVASSCRVLSDSLFAFLLTCAVTLMVRFLQRSRPAEEDGFAATYEDSGRTRLPDATGRSQRRVYAWLVGVAVVLAAATYVRPVGLAMAAAFLMALVLVARRLRKIALFAAVFIACIAPWVARNQAVAGYAGFSSFSAEGLYDYTVPAMMRQMGTYRDVSHYAAYDGPLPPDLLTKKAPPEMDTIGKIVQMKSDEARQFIFDHPLVFLEVHFRGTLAFWLPGAPDVLEVAGLSQGNRGTLTVLHEQGLWAATRHYFGDNTTAVAVAIPLVVIYVVQMAGVLLCVLAGARRILRLRPETWLLALLVILSFILPGVAAYPRFRVPVEPILNIAAAGGWMWIVGRFRHPKLSGSKS